MLPGQSYPYQNQQPPAPSSGGGPQGVPQRQLPPLNRNAAPPAIGQRAAYFGMSPDAWHAKSYADRQQMVGAATKAGGYQVPPTPPANHPMGNDNVMRPVTPQPAQRTAPNGYQVVPGSHGQTFSTGTFGGPGVREWNTQNPAINSLANKLKGGQPISSAQTYLGPPKQVNAPQGGTGSAPGLQKFGGQPPRGGKPKPVQPYVGQGGIGQTNPRTPPVRSASPTNQSKDYGKGLEVRKSNRARMKAKAAKAVGKK